MNDGLRTGEELVLTANATGSISAANLVATGSVVTAGLTNTGTASATNILATGSIVGAGLVSSTNIVATGSIMDVKGRLYSAATGSPSVFGLSVQTGSVALSAGSNAWIVFGTPFSGGPIVNVCHGDLTLAYVAVGSCLPGSAYVIGATASKIVNWTAVGLP